MAVDLSGVTAITIPEGAVTRIEDSNGSVLWKKVTRVDLLAACTNKGWRNTRNQISGDGTDPNWQYGRPVEIRGQTRISCFIHGYSTVCAVMYFTASMGILSGLTDTQSLSDSPIPAGAAYVAVCCRNQQGWPGQFCYME